MLIIDNDPSKVRLVGYDNKLDELKRILTYHDKKVDFEIVRHKNATWFSRKYGEEAYREKLEELQSQKIKTLLFADKDLNCRSLR